MSELKLFKVTRGISKQMEVIENKKLLIFCIASFLS